MRRRIAGLVAAAAFASACSSSSAGGGADAAPPGDDGGVGGDGAMPGATCVGPVSSKAPSTNACPGDATRCIAGTLANANTLAASPVQACASLYQVLPQGAAPLIATQMVAVDGTWAFGDLSAWAHYYVKLVGDFRLPDGTGASIPAIVGPLAVPSAGPISAQLKPVTLQVLESRVKAGTRQVLWASARVYDPQTGGELSKDGATVSIAIGGVSTPMAWTDNGYYAAFSPPPVASASYTVSTTIGSTTRTWTLTSDPPAFDGAITSPANGATVAPGPLAVMWSAAPDADYELVEIFARGDGGWSATPAYTSAAPNRADTTSETTSSLDSGSYLLNVAYAKASCPTSADGCVLSNAVADARFTVQ
jgi:hypothetical protein